MTSAVKILTGARNGRTPLLNKQGKCICDCAIHQHIPLEDFYFLDLNGEHPVKDNFKKKSSVVKLRLPKLSANMISSLF